MRLNKLTDPTRGLLATLLIAVLCAALAPAAATAQELPDEEQLRAMMAKSLELAQPGPEHARFAQMVGTWDMEMTLWPEPGAEALTTSGVVEAELILGGRYLMQTTVIAEGFFASEGISILGFDRRSEEYTLLGLDTIGTYWVSAQGPRGRLVGRRLRPDFRRHPGVRLRLALGRRRDLHHPDHLQGRRPYPRGRAVQDGRDRGPPPLAAREQPMSESRRTKDIDLTIEIDADAETVWRAISDGKEISSWFPLNADVDPRVGGKYEIDWGPDCAGQGTITDWEEGVRLRYEEEWPGADLEVPVTVEYTIESRDGKTIVRMVNAGFSAEEDWADYLDTIDSGWRYFLWNLKVYVERHAGTPRRMVWDRRKIAVDKAEAWKLLLGEGGLAATTLPATADESVMLWSGVEGTTALVNEPIHFTARFESINDALLLIELEPGQGEYSLGVWLSLYGVDEAQAVELERSLKATLDSLFAVPA